MKGAFANSIYRCLIVLLCLACRSAFGQDATSRQDKAPMMSMPMVAPLFLEDSQFSSALTLVNERIAPIHTQVILTDIGGAELTRETIHLSGHSTRTLEIRKILSNAESKATIGSVLVLPEMSRSMAVAAQLSITHRIGPVPSYLEEELVSPENTDSNMLRAAAIDVKGSPVVVLKSMRPAAQNVTLRCISERSETLETTVELGVGQMLLTEPCLSLTRRPDHVIEDSLRSEDKQQLGAVGIELRTTAKSSDLVAYGFSVHDSSGERSFTSLDFEDPAGQHSGSTIYAGLPVGPTNVFRNISFRPELALANFSERPANVTVTFARTTNEQPQVRLAATVPLAPRTTHTVVLPTEGEPDMRNSFIVDSDAELGAVQSKLVSWGTGPVKVVELQGKEEHQERNAGGHPWTIENGITSLILLFNHTSGSAKYFNVNISSGGTLWHRGYELRSMETRVLSINELVTKDAKDEHGLVLPKNVHSGEVSWFTVGASNHGTGRLLQLNPNTGLARSLSCGYCIVLCGNNFSPDTSITIGEQNSDFLGDNQPQTCTAWACNACSGDPMGPGGGFSNSWWSGNTSIAPISGSTTNSRGFFVGQQIGTTQGFGSVSDGQGCTMTSVGPISVTCAVPTNYHQTSGSGDSSGVLHFQYAWGSSTGKLADLAACTMREYVTYPGTSPYHWSSPPYVATSTTFPVTRGGPASDGTAPDTHGHPNFLKPYKSNSFTVTQYYQYICPCANNGQPVNVMGPLSIVRSVSLVNGVWKYSITKSGKSATTTLP